MPNRRLAAVATRLDELYHGARRSLRVQEDLLEVRGARPEQLEAGSNGLVGRELEVGDHIGEVMQPRPVTVQEAGEKVLALREVGLDRFELHAIRESNDGGLKPCGGTLDNERAAQIAPIAVHERGPIGSGNGKMVEHDSSDHLGKGMGSQRRSPTRRTVRSGTPVASRRGAWCPPAVWRRGTLFGTGRGTRSREEWSWTMDDSKYRSLKLTREDRILTIAFDRPEVHNAINKEVHRELATVFTEADLDPDVDVIVLAGTGDAFSAGGDFDWLRSLRADPVEAVDTMRNDRRIQNSMLDLEKPIIAKVRGAAVGLGCSLALFCDFVYATPESRFADPHVAVGLVAGDGGAVIWPQLIGYARARRYLLTGDFISGREAAEIGLITEAVADADLDETVATMARRMRDGSRYALRWTKASINAELKAVANAVMDRAAGYELMTQTTMQDHGIALEALENKQRPKFTGR